MVVARSAVAFDVIKYVGAVYLAYLGVRMLLRREQGFAMAAVAAQGVRRAFAEGVIVEALNVKTALFFLAFLPQFIAPGEPMAPQWLLLGSFCVALNTGVDCVAVFGIRRIFRAEALRAARAGIMTKVSGVTLLLLAASLAIVRRPT